MGLPSKKFCAGCLVKLNYTDRKPKSCKWKYKLCPCTNCLVKGMCDEACNKFIKIYASERIPFDFGEYYNEAAKYIRHVVDKNILNKILCLVQNKWLSSKEE